uniref:XK-related protein n=1 Tax=Meloidogyne hapla TaxID=6305 RepID=A0A1I8AYN7_MELHA
MCFQTVEHILIVMFQVLVLMKIEYYQYLKEQIQLSWLLVFSPLFLESFIAMIIAIWCMRHEKPYEVLVPTWIVFSLFLLCSIYSLTIALFLNRTFYAHQQHIPSHRRPRLCASVCHVFLTIPFLLHLLLLASKLDYLDSPGTSKSGNTSFVLIALPLEISLFILLLLSFGARPANVWWFGMRQSFCNFIFQFFPCLRHYVNISCKFGVRGSDASSSTLSWGQRFSRRNRIRQNRNHPPTGNSSARIYGIEEPTTPWVINSTDEEQRIIITETINNCETGNHPQQQSTSRLSKKQQMENRQKEKQVIAYLFVRGSIESPD